MSSDSQYCECCGQLLPEFKESGNWGRKRGPNRIGIGISIALHLLGVLYYFLAPTPQKQHAAPPSKGQMVYIEPLKQKSTPEKPQKKTEVAKASKPPPPPRKQVATKSIPTAVRPKLETYVPPVQATMTPPPPQDMSEMIAKRRAEREAQNPAPPAPPAPETDKEKGLRIAKANIAGAQGRSNGADRDDTGGIFSVDKSYHSAEVKFRGWNTNFKRNWTQQVHVDQGGEIDIETAVAKKMIEVIRKEKQGDFEWDSRRLGKVVMLSARKEDEKELIAFLLKEMFPEYKR